MCFLSWICCQLPDCISVLVVSAVSFTIDVYTCEGIELSYAKSHHVSAQIAQWLWKRCQAAVSLRSSAAFFFSFINKQKAISQFHSLPASIWDMQMGPFSGAQASQLNQRSSRSRLLPVRSRPRREPGLNGRNPDRGISAERQTPTRRSAHPEAPLHQSPARREADRNRKRGRSGDK